MLTYILLSLRCGVVVLLFLLQWHYVWGIGIAHMEIAIRRMDWQDRPRRWMLPITKGPPNKHLLCKADFSNCAQIIENILFLPLCDRSRLWESRLGSSASGWATVMVACDNDKEIPHPTQGRAFLECLSDYRLVMASEPCNHLVKVRLNEVERRKERMKKKRLYCDINCV